MPVVGIPLTYLQKFLNTDHTAQELIDIFHDIGISVDGIEQAQRYTCTVCNEITELVSESVPPFCDSCGHAYTAENKDFTRLQPVEMFRLELLANRPDNFDAAGIARSMKGYLNKETGITPYAVLPSEYTVSVDPQLLLPDSSRPCIACAVVKDVAFDDDTIKSIMKLQENLHWALGRNRKFAAIGLYDLSTIGKHINYRAAADNEIEFVPLACGGSSITCALSPKAILEQHPKGKAFAHLLGGYVRYPLLVDDKGTVLSMPPIINSEKTRVGKKTKDLFIDVTGFSRDTVNKVLAIVVTSLKECMPQCTLHTVTINYSADSAVTPDMATETFTLNYQRCNSLIGCDIAGNEIVACLKRMRFEAQDAGDHCVVQVPCYRTDIRHEQDLIEDVAIAYGYHNLKPRKLEAFTTGTILPAERTKQQIREMLVSMGFLEIVTIMLTSEQREFITLGLPVASDRVIIDNPISTDQTIVRTGLTAGLLEIIAANTSNELPQKLFEVGETVRVDPLDATVIEEVKLAAGIVHSKAGFSDIKAVLKNTMHEFGIAWELAPANLPFHIPGRSATIIVNNEPVGHIGELHPSVLDICKIPSPVVLLELNITKLGYIDA